jgi:hypothetical protein
MKQIHYDNKWFFVEVKFINKKDYEYWLDNLQNNI